MDIFIEVLGTVTHEVIKDTFKNGSRYILFRLASNNSPQDDITQFNCIIAEGMPAFTYADSIKLNNGDTLLVRGRFQQKQVCEEKIEVNKETMKQERVKHYYTKNRIYVATLNLILKSAEKNVEQQIFTSESVKNTDNSRQKEEYKPGNNPFGD